MAYRLAHGTESVQRLSDGAWIPRDIRNIDYQAFLKWEEQGNVVTTAGPAPAPYVDPRDAEIADLKTRLLAVEELTRTR